MNCYDIIIIGGGPAGYSCALYSARAGLSVAVIEKIGPGGQLALTDVIDNYPGFEEGIDGISLGLKMQSTAERFGSVTLYEEVISVELSGKEKIITTDSGKYTAAAVIIATGATPRRLGLVGEEALTSRGVHYCAHCDGMFYKDKTVAVVGGGNSAVGDALYLSRICKEVLLIHRRSELRATNIYLDQIDSAKNIKFLKNKTVSEIYGKDRLSGFELTDVQTGEKQTVEADALFVSIGREPATALFGGILELDKNGYILAGEDTKTSIEGVFAAGDVRTKHLRQVVTAVSDGAVAATMAEEYINKKRPLL